MWTQLILLLLDMIKCVINFPGLLMVKMNDLSLIIDRVQFQMSTWDQPFTIIKILIDFCYFDREHFVSGLHFH